MPNWSPLPPQTLSLYLKNFWAHLKRWRLRLVFLSLSLEKQNKTFVSFFKLQVCFNSVKWIGTWRAVILNSFRVNSTNFYTGWSVQILRCIKWTFDKHLFHLTLSFLFLKNYFAVNRILFSKVRSIYSALTR